jgi:hypothetical protein
MENQVRNSPRTLLSRQQKTLYPDPNESSLLTLPASASTLRSSASPEEAIGGKERLCRLNQPMRLLQKTIL